MFECKREHRLMTHHQIFLYEQAKYNFLYQKLVVPLITSTIFKIESMSTNVPDRPIPEKYNRQSFCFIKEKE